MISAAVLPLKEEFDRLADSGRTLDLWWRDDDATRRTMALDRLLGLSAAFGAPLAVAAIPAVIEASLPDRLAERPDIAVLVHGWAHANHALPGEKPAEFGPHRSTSALRREAGQGLREADAAFGPALVPVFVPPWNRIAPALVPALAGFGYRALSAFGRAGDPAADSALRRLDTHLDPVDWRGTRSLADPARLAAALRDAVATSRQPVGLLTHHLAFDEALWDFCERLLELASAHRAVRFVSVRDLAGREPRAPLRHSPPDAGRLGSPAVEAACP